MTLTLDPRLPLLWRTPDSLQCGVDKPPVVLQGVSTAHERMLDALAIGLTPQGLALIGTEAGLTAAQVADFERAIRPALLTPKVSISVNVDIDGFGPTADRLDWRLREAGLLSRRAPACSEGATEIPPESPPTFAIIVGEFVLDPERRGRWLRRDIPHLPIVYGDESVMIGPFIETGTGPCLYCLELHRRDADPAWPALASQLMGTVSAAQQPFIASEAATIATRLVLSRMRNGAAASATSLTVDVETGGCRRQTWQAHPECACAGISLGITNSNANSNSAHAASLSAQCPPETAKEHSSRPADRVTETTKVEVAGAPV